MINFVRSLSTRKGNCKPPWKVLFFGTDRFAVHPLKALIENNRTSGSIIKLINVVCPPERRRVIKKPQNGQSLDTVREFSLKHNIPIYFWLGKEGWEPHEAYVSHLGPVTLSPFAYPKGRGKVIALWFVEKFVTHGGYSRWSRWYPCSRTCGEGTQKRYRWCNNPRPKNGGRDCRGLGKARESRRCNRRRCPVHGGYSRWGSWSECDVTCGVGYKQRMRTCTNPSPAHGGRHCFGKRVEYKMCHLNICPVAKCNDPGKPENGTKDGEDYRSGANVTFQCYPPFELLGSPTIHCKNGKWSSSTPICTTCGRPVITSYALNGQSAWCTERQTYLQIRLRRAYKLTAIATQGGTRYNAWVKRYRIIFNAGATPIYYSEAGSEKVIKGNEDSSSVVVYQFKEPFVSKIVRIYRDVVNTSPLCSLRMELYGCEPDPDCILVGSLFWGLWTRKDNSLNYYRAYITKVNATHLDFALEVNKAQTRSYERTDQVLITDKAVEMQDISVNSRVIAVHEPRMQEWYRTGNVTYVSGSLRSASIKFDNGDQRLHVPLGQLRLVKRPVYCKDNL